MQSIQRLRKNAMEKGKKRGAFTLIEIIIVVLIMAVLVALFYPSIMSNKDKSTISATVGNDVKLLSGAITEWKNSSANSDGSYSNITTAEIVPYLPSTMKYDNANGVITSSGLNGGIAYKIASAKITTNGDSFKVYIDFSKAISEHKYDDRLKNYAETIAVNDFKKMSTDLANATTDNVATDIGGANADFTNGGTTVDGKAGVNKIVF